MTMKTNIRSKTDRNDRGIAILFVLIALLILTAITAALVILSGTETTVNYNYRTEETAFFAAKTGIYEALDRMQQTNSATIATSIPTVPPSATGGVVYLINAGSSLTVQPWTVPTSSAPNPYFDTEFCHEGYSISGMSAAEPDIPCSSVPTGSSWYTTATSNYPWSGTSAAIPYEWVRINWKQNNTQSYLSGTGTPTQAYYKVNSGQSSGTSVCYNGGSEVLLSSSFARCEQYWSCGNASPTVSTPVYMITALAVTPNGSRQMVQAEAALNPPSVTASPSCGASDPYGFFAYSSTCSSGGSGSPFQLGGGGSQALNTDGYNSANGTYAATKSATGGAVGSNGSLWLHGHSVNIGGTVYVQPTTAACPQDFYTDGSPTYVAQANSSYLQPPTENIPNNTSGTPLNVTSSQTLTAGSGVYYQNVSVSGNGTVLTLTAPGTYNFNCLSVGAHAQITISPSNKAVTINITGNNCSSGNVIDFNSQAQINNTGVASNLQFVYPGTGTVNLVGAPSAYGVIIAPKAAVTLHGGTDFYGSIIANTIVDDGNVALHFDHALTTIDGTAASIATATATGSYNILAFHSVPY